MIDIAQQMKAILRVVNWGVVQPEFKEHILNYWLYLMALGIKLSGETIFEKVAEGFGQNGREDNVTNC